MISSSYSKCTTTHFHIFRVFLLLTFIFSSNSPSPESLPRNVQTAPDSTSTAINNVPEYCEETPAILAEIAQKVNGSQRTQVLKSGFDAVGRNGEDFLYFVKDLGTLLKVVAEHVYVEKLEDGRKVGNCGNGISVDFKIYEFDYKCDEGRENGVTLECFYERALSFNYNDYMERSKKNPAISALWDKKETNDEEFRCALDIDWALNLLRPFEWLAVFAVESWALYRKEIEYEANTNKLRAELHNNETLYNDDKFMRKLNGMNDKYKLIKRLLDALQDMESLHKIPRINKTLQSAFNFTRVGVNFENIYLRLIDRIYQKSSDGSLPHAQDTNAILSLLLRLESKQYLNKRHKHGIAFGRIAQKKEISRDAISDLYQSPTNPFAIWELLSDLTTFMQVLRMKIQTTRGEENTFSRIVDIPKSKYVKCTSHLVEGWVKMFQAEDSNGLKRYNAQCGSSNENYIPCFYQENLNEILAEYELDWSADPTIIKLWNNANAEKLLDKVVGIVGVKFHRSDLRDNLTNAANANFSLRMINTSLLIAETINDHLNLPNIMLEKEKDKVYIEIRERLWVAIQALKRTKTKMEVVKERHAGMIRKNQIKWPRIHSGGIFIRHLQHLVPRSEESADPPGGQVSGISPPGGSSSGGSTALVSEGTGSPTFSGSRKLEKGPPTGRSGAAQISEKTPRISTPSQKPEPARLTKLRKSAAIQSQDRSSRDRSSRSKDPGSGSKDSTPKQPRVKSKVDSQSKPRSSNGHHRSRDEKKGSERKE